MTLQFRRATELFVGIFFSLLCCANVSAQHMYRCGSVYQDRPCEGGQQGKRIGSTGSSETAKPVADADCAKRGANTLKIVWAREAGASAERQLSDAQGSDARKLIADVYNKRGSAPEVRAAIEADCMVEKERAAQAAAMYGATRGTDAQQPSSSEKVSSQSTEKSGKQNESKRHEDSESTKAEIKKTTCDSLKTELTDIKANQRRGGNAETMEDLRQQLRTTNDRIRDTGC